MLFEQHQLQTPTIKHDGGGCSTANPFLSSLDFHLLDDINLYLPSVHSKKNKNECLLTSQITHPNEHEIKNSNDDEQQQHEEFFSNLDFSNLAEFDEKSGLIDYSADIDDWELDKWISESAFPSPPMEVCPSPSQDSTASSSTIPWIGEECTIQSVSTDMTVPLSPPVSTVSSSPAPSARKSSKKASLSMTERKLRKKDQNKTAAEKYRVKKKSEKHSVFDQHIKLKAVNRDLKIEAENLNFRIQQLKQLFIDLVQVQLPSTMEQSN